MVLKGNLSIFKHFSGFLIKYVLGKQNYVKMKCFHEKTMFSHSHKIRWFYGKEKTRPGHTNEVFSRKNSRFSHKITFVIKYGLGKKNHMKEMCFHEKIQIFGQNKILFTAKHYHIIFGFVI